MPVFDKIKAGDRLWDCHRTKMGNTTLTKMGSWTVDVKEVDPVKRKALVSWNGNRPEWWGEGQLRRLRRSPVKEKRTGW